MVDSRAGIARFYGFDSSYAPSLAVMNDLHSQVCQGIREPELMLLEYAPVITYTKVHGLAQVRSSVEHINKDGIALELADRGGDITFHGPGQLVGYPIFLLKRLDGSAGAPPDIGSFVRTLERALLHAARELGVSNAELSPGYSGVWVRSTDREHSLKKLAAIGMRIKNGVSMHGFAFNLTIDHARFTKHIVPCGLEGRGVVSLKEALELVGLEMPETFDIVCTVAESIAKEFSMALKLDNFETLRFGENGNGKQHHHAPIGRIYC